MRRLRRVLVPAKWARTRTIVEALHLADVVDRRYC